MVEVEILIGIVGYGIAIWTWNSGHKVNGLLLSFAWTISLFLITPVQYHDAVWLLILLHIGLLLSNMRLFGNKLKILTGGGR